MVASETTHDLEKRRFTIRECLLMVDSGVIDSDEPVELLNGELIVVSPQGSLHLFVTTALRALLANAYGNTALVLEEKPLRVEPDSLPEPDVAVLRGDLSDYAHELPGANDALLVVEVAVTSQHADRAKAAVYARAGVPIYWLIDVPARTVAVHSEPDGERYVRIESRSAQQILELPSLSDTVAIAKLFPVG